MHDDDYYLLSPYTVARLKDEPEMRIRRHDINLDYGLSLIVNERRAPLTESEIAGYTAAAVEAAVETVNCILADDERRNGRHRRNRDRR